jgi:hypothetical protein
MGQTAPGDESIGLGTMEAGLGSAAHMIGGRSPLRYRVRMASPEQAEKASKDAAVAAEAVRVQRLRADAQRPMAVNLAETIALSHQLLQFAGAARRG